MTLLTLLALSTPLALAQGADETASPEEAIDEDLALSWQEAGPVFVQPGFLHETLDNGMAVSILSAPEHPVVATQIWVQVGSAHETDSEKGFAHLFEHMMFGDTETYGKEDYARHHTANGGYENAYTAFDNTVYISEIAPAAHDQVLVFEADRMVNLTLSQENLDNEKKIVTEELRLRTENDPMSRLLIMALAGFFGEHPYAHSPAGTKEDIQGADLELARKFYEGYYRPANMHLVVVGPVDGPSTLARIDELFGPLPTEHAAPPEIPELSGWTFPDRIVLKEDIPPIKIAAQVYPTPAAGSEDQWALMLMGQMLSGGEVDRFREELVTRRGKAIEGGSAHFDQTRAGGLMIFGSVSLPTRRRGRALRLVDQTVNHLAEEAWLTEENLATARRVLLRQELEGRYYADNRASAVGQYGSWLGEPELGVEGIADELAAVTLEDVRRVWRSYVAEAEPVEVFIKKGNPQ